MKNSAKIILMGFLLCFLQPVFGGHSFDIVSVSFSSSGATIVGEATENDSLNLPMTALVCNGANTQSFTGSSHTFTAVGEQFVFAVNFPANTFAQGDQVLVSVTDDVLSGDCNNGTQGNIGTFTYLFTLPVPMMDPVGLSILILMAMLIGGLALSRMRFSA